MKEIVKVLLQEGIDEETIHEVLDIIDERKGDPTVGEVSRAARKTLHDRLDKDLARDGELRDQIRNSYRFDKALELAKLPADSKTPYKKVRDAATKSLDSRKKEHWGQDFNDTDDRPSNRLKRAVYLNRLGRVGK